MANNIIPLPCTGGVNLLNDPKRIRDDEVVKAGNIFPVKPGILGKRQALTYVGGLGPFDSGGPGSEKVMSAITPNFATQYSIVYTKYITGTPDAITCIAGNPGPASESNGIITSQPSIGSKLRPWMFCFNSKTYILLGDQSNFPGYILQSAPAGSIANGDIQQRSNGTEFIRLAFTGADNTAMFPKVACAYRNRVVWANMGKGYENYIVFSDNFLPLIVGDNALADNGRNIIVGGNRDGDEIVAVKEIMLTAIGSPAQSALLVLKQYSAYLITGEPNQTTDPSTVVGNLNVAQISFDCGCASPWTVVTTPYGTIWASWEDIWLFRTGQAPVRIGSKIRSALQYSPEESRYKWSAAYFNGVYRLGIMSDGQGPDDFALCGEQWWLDLRNLKGTADNLSADTAEWWGPQTFKLAIYPSGESGFVTTTGTVAFAQETRPGYTPALFEVAYGFNYDQDDINGPGYALLQYDTNSTRDLTFNTYPDTLSPPFPLMTQYSSGDTTILTDLWTKEYDFQDASIDKNYYATELSIYNGNDIQVTIDSVADAGYDIKSTIKIMPQSGFTLGVDALDMPVRLSKKAQREAFYVDPTSRQLGGTYQLKLYDTSGIVVNETNNVVLFYDENTPLTYAIPLVDGLYTSIDAMMSMLSTQVELVTGFPLSIGVGSNGVIDIQYGSGGNYTFIFQEFFGPPFDGTAEQRAKTRKIGAILGFDTTVTPSTANDQIAQVSVFRQLASTLEVSALNMVVNPIPRRPS